MIRAVAVVVPAHDEEELLTACLESVRRAALHPALRGLRVEAVVVADSCRDATAGAGRAGGAHVVEADVRSAGAARALGTAHALRRLTDAGTSLPGLPGLSVDEVWLAHTDADSRVPRRWLAAQLARAAEGCHAVVGTVTVGDWSPHTPATAARFREHYTAHRARSAAPGAAHPHVHGANLAVRADAYTAVGGFPRVPTGEDRALVAALDAAGWRVRRTEAHPVLTSARRVPRAPGGFGDFLLGMEALESLETPEPLEPLEHHPSRGPSGRRARRPAYGEGHHAGSGRHV